MQKRYKLIKDLPDINKGVVFTWNKSRNCYIGEKSIWVSPDRYSTFSKGTVEQSPDWFEEVKEIKLDVPIGTRFKVEGDKDIFTIKCVELGKVQVSWSTECTTVGYEIEDVNRYFKEGSWTIYKEKEFEILEYSTKSREWRAQYAAHLPVGEEYIISAVKRLSDNIIFKIGEKITYLNHPDKDAIGTITEIEVDNFFEGGVCICTDKIGIVSLNYVKHYPILFTKDEYECSLEDELYSVHYTWETGYTVCKTLFNKEGQKWSSNGDWLYFKYKENRDKYIDDNKPMFSKKQIRDAIDVCDSYYTTHDDNYYVKVSHLKRLLRL